MKIAIPIIDTEANKNTLAGGGLDVNGSLCLYDNELQSGEWIKTLDLASHMGDLLPALEAMTITAIITKQIHPMALKVLVNRGFEVFKAKGKELDENIRFFNENQLDVYSYGSALKLANSCGGACNTCSTDVCDDEK